MPRKIKFFNSFSNSKAICLTKFIFSSLKSLIRRLTFFIFNTEELSSDLICFFLSLFFKSISFSKALFFVIREFTDSRISFDFNKFLSSLIVLESNLDILSDSIDVDASILLTPDEIEDSERILNCPISEVLPTCVPPHSSKENLSSILTTLTLSPYFSPKRAVAPFFLASSMLTLFSILTLIFSKILSLTISLILSKESTSILEKCEKSNLNIFSFTSDPFCEI